VKVLIAGLGSAGQRHARNLRALYGDDVELLAYRVRRTSPVINADMTADRDGDVEAALGVRSFDDLGSALSEAPDAVFVTNPNHLHVRVALEAARAGSHLFVEKPVSSDLDGLDELGVEVERRGLVCLVGYQLRFHPGYRLLARLLADGALGALLAVRVEFGEYLPGWHPYEDYREYHAARRDQGGGVVLAQIHDLDLVYSLFGLPSRVFALGGKRSSLELDAEDTVDVLLDCGPPVHVHQDLVQRPPVRVYELVGETAKAAWDAYAGTVSVTRSDGSREAHDVSIERNELFLAELRHFFACVRGEETPVVDLRGGVDSLRIALAVRQSLATGEVVTPA
jgi:predicted dehydrogenase